MIARVCARLPKTGPPGANDTVRTPVALWPRPWPRPWPPGLRKAQLFQDGAVADRPGQDPELGASHEAQVLSPSLNQGVGCQAVQYEKDPYDYLV